MRRPHRTLLGVIFIFLFFLVKDEKFNPNELSPQFEATTLDDSELFHFKKDIKVGIKQQSLLRLKLSTVEQRNL